MTCIKRALFYTRNVPNGTKTCINGVLQINVVSVREKDRVNFKFEETHFSLNDVTTDSVGLVVDHFGDKRRRRRRRVWFVPRRNDDLGCSTG